VCSCSEDKEKVRHTKKNTAADREKEYSSENSEIRIGEETVTKYNLGDRIINIKKISGKSQSFILLNIHEDETTSINVALDITKEYGGEFVYLVTSGNRNISFELDNKAYTFDPNRIFTKAGIRKTLENLSGYSKNAESEINEFAQFIIKEITHDSKCIIAVHNNTDGSYSADSYYGEYKKDGASIFKNKTEDSDDFFFVTRKIDFEYLKSKGYNVILQDNENVRDDGSLSVYCGKNDIPYINVETQDGKYKKQYEMLEVIIQKIISE
jgi:hypothetical protein